MIVVDRMAEEMEEEEVVVTIKVTSRADTAGEEEEEAASTEEEVEATWGEEEAMTVDAAILDPTTTAQTCQITIDRICPITSSNLRDNRSDRYPLPRGMLLLPRVDLLPRAVKLLVENESERVDGVEKLK